jgi:hypothetical protein
MVTAFFDIQRDTKGDGRTVHEYMQWMEKTLQLNCNLFIVTETKFVPFVKEKNPRAYILEDTLENASYYKYLPRMKEILESDDYKQRIAHPQRVECVLPEYNVIQYSKFGWLEQAIRLNPFQTDTFYWMDAGISRFFGNIDITLPYPRHIHTDQFIIQPRQDIWTYPIDDSFLWKADNLFKGGMFGGKAKIVTDIGKKVEEVFQTMLSHEQMNNEQLAIALVWKKYPEMFHLVSTKMTPCDVALYLSNTP